MKSILDPSFRYTTSVNTDIRRTFARVRRERQKQLKRAEASRKVLQLSERKRATP